VNNLLKQTPILARLELGLLALALPFLLFPGRWSPLLLLPLLLLWPIRRLVHGHFTRPSAMHLPLGLLLLVALIGYWIAPDRAMSWAKLWGIVLQAAIFWGLLNGLRSQRALKQVGPLLVGGTLGVALFSLVGTDWDSVRLLDWPALYERLPRLAHGLPGSGVPRLSEFFHPRQVGGTMAFLLPPVLLYTWSRAGWGWPRLWGAVTLVVGSLVLLLSLAPAGYLGLVVALLAIGLWRSRWLLLPLAGLPVLALLIYRLAAWRPAALALLDVQNILGVGVVLRLDIWSRSLAMVRDMPYTGVGLNNFPIVQAHFYPGVLLGPNEVHAHNLFLQTAVDLGLPGLLALLWLLVAFYVTLWRAYRLTTDREIRWLLVGLAAGVLAYVAGGLPDAITLGAKPVAAVAAMWGVAAAALAQAESETAPAPARGVSKWVGAGLLGGLLLLTLLLTLLFPAAWLYNRAAVTGHQALLASRMAAEPDEAAVAKLVQATAWLEEAVAAELPLGQGQAAQAMALWGSLAAWQGDYETAVAALGCRVALDGPEGMGRYAPFETARRYLAGEPAAYGWEDTIRLYRQWRTRYPERAEAYVQLALAHLARGAGNDEAQAASVWQQGSEGPALPVGLLTRSATIIDDFSTSDFHACPLDPKE
jgi:putative inorganic carbon (hco3(-)) transporter